METRGREGEESLLESEHRMVVLVSTPLRDMSASSEAKRSTMFTSYVHLKPRRAADSGDNSLSVHRFHIVNITALNTEIYDKIKNISFIYFTGIVIKF